MVGSNKSGIIRSTFGPAAIKYLFTGMSMPLPKKRKLDHNDENEVYSVALLSDIDAEIALEISLRKRLIDTLESRVAWATALKEILQQQGANVF
jgi:hypothetical protein